MLIIILHYLTLIVIGTVLAQLVIKSICILENIGIKVEGVVSDGASTNRKLWVELGTSGQKNNISNSFENPMDPKRKIFYVCGCPTFD